MRSEKEKCAAGELYDANHDTRLLAERQACAELLHELHQLRPSQCGERAALLRRILGRTGGSLSITPPFFCDYGYNIEIGDNFFANAGCVILDEAPVRFGDNVFVGPSCGFYTASHPLDPALRRRGLETARPITVGNDVWIGGSVTVLPGVTIGDGAVIGAGSVVTRDVPPGWVASGNPCRLMREITENEDNVR